MCLDLKVAEIFWNLRVIDLSNKLWDRHDEGYDFASSPVAGFDLFAEEEKDRSASFFAVSSHPAAAGTCRPHLQPRLLILK